MWRNNRTVRPSADDAVEADLDRAGRAGFRLAVIGRSVAMTAIAIYYGYVIYWPSGLYAFAAVMAVVALGLVSLCLLGTRHEHMWHRYALFAFDVAVFGIYVALVPLSSGDEVPQNLAFVRGITLVFIVIAASVLTLSPALVMWTGACAVLALWAATGWIMAGMERVVTWSDLPPAPSREQFLAVVLDPDFIALQTRVMDSITILVVTGIAALAVHRARVVVRARAAAEHQRNRIQRLFGQYVPEQVAAALIASGEALAPQTREASVMFADIKDFTRLSEALAPADVIGLLNRFFDESAALVTAHGGVVVNFVGDAMVIAFNAPLPAADHAARAIEAARALLSLAEARDFGGHRLALRIGVASGPVAAGSVGGAGRQTYTIYGDTVNLAQRLQLLTKDLDTDCLISDATYFAAGATGDGAVANGTVAVRGREQPVQVFAIAGPAPAHGTPLSSTGMHMTDIDIRIESPASAVASALIAALDADLTRRYPGEPTNGIDAAAFEADGGVFAVGYVDGEPAFCGALRPYEGAAEIKRMFVATAFRGRGLGRRMLQFLEREAIRRGYGHAVLETGTGQPEAISLYRSQGWRPIPTFGPYVGNPLSTCFEKRLDKLA